MTNFSADNLSSRKQSSPVSGWNDVIRRGGRTVSRSSDLASKILNQPADGQDAKTVAALKVASHSIGEVAFKLTEKSTVSDLTFQLLTKREKLAKEIRKSKGIISQKVKNDAKAILSEVERLKTSETYNDIIYTPRVYTELFDLCYLVDDLPSAESLYAEIEKEHHHTWLGYRNLIKMYAKAEDLQKARKIFDKMSSDTFVHPSLSDYNEMFKLCLKVRDLPTAKLIFGEMDKKVLPNAETYLLLFNLCQQKNDLDQAQVWYDGMPEKCFSPDNAHVLINMFLVAGNLSLATSCYKEISRLGMTPLEKTDNLITQPISSIKVAPDLDQATSKLSIEKKVWASKAVVSSYNQSSEEDRKVDHLYDSEEHDIYKYTPIPISEKDVKENLAKLPLPNKLPKFTFTFAIGKPITEEITSNLDRLLNENEKKAEAHRLSPQILANAFFARIKELNRPLDLKAYNKLMEICLCVEDLKSATSFFEEMRLKAIPPDVTTYEYLIELHAKFGQADDATKLFNEMKKREIPYSVTVYNSFILLSTRQNVFERGQFFYNEIKKVSLSPNWVTFCRLFQLCIVASRGSLQCALDGYNDMEPTDFNASSYTALIDVCVSKGDLAKAKALRGEMESKKLKPRTSIVYNFNGLLTASLPNAKNQVLLGQSMTTKNSVVPAVSTVLSKSISPETRKPEADRKTVSAASVVSANFPIKLSCNLIKKGEIYGLTSIYNQELNKYTTEKDIPNRQAFNKLFFARIEEVCKGYRISLSLKEYHELILLCKEARDLMRARGFLKELKELRIEPTATTYEYLLRICAANEDLESANEFCKEIDKRNLFDLKTSKTLMGIYINRSYFKIKENFLDKIQDKFSPDLQLFNNILFVFLQLQDFDNIKSTYERMKKEKAIPNAQTYKRLFQACYINKDLPQALAWYKEMKDVAFTKEIGESLIRVCAAVKDDVQAELFFKELRERKIEHNEDTYRFALKRRLEEDEKAGIKEQDPCRPILHVGADNDQLAESISVRQDGDKQSLRKSAKEVTKSWSSSVSKISDQFTASQPCTKKSPASLSLPANLGVSSRMKIDYANTTVSSAKTSKFYPLIGSKNEFSSKLKEFVDFLKAQINDKNSELDSESLEYAKECMSNLDSYLRTPGLDFDERKERVYTYLSEICDSLDDVENAEWLEQEILSNVQKPNFDTYSAYLRLHCRHAQIEKAEKAFECLKASNNLEIGTYNTILKLYGQKGMMVKAKGIFDLLKSEKTAPDSHTYYHLFLAYEETEEYRQVDEWFNELVQANDPLRLDPYVHHALIRLYANTEDYSIVNQHLEFMQKNNVPPLVTTFNFLINLYKFDPEKVKFYLQEMDKSGVEAVQNTYKSLLDVCEGNEALSISSFPLQIYEKLKKKQETVDSASNNTLFDCLIRQKHALKKHDGLFSELFESNIKAQAQAVGTIDCSGLSYGAVCFLVNRQIKSITGQSRITVVFDKVIGGREDASKKLHNNVRDFIQKHFSWKMQQTKEINSFTLVKSGNSVNGKSIGM